MAEKNIRIGRVSSIDYGSGMISVTYPDLDDSVTDDLPVFQWGTSTRCLLSEQRCLYCTCRMGARPEW